MRYRLYHLKIVYIHLLMTLILPLMSFSERHHDKDFFIAASKFNLKKFSFKKEKKLSSQITFVLRENLRNLKFINAKLITQSTCCAIKSYKLYKHLSQESSL